MDIAWELIPVKLELKFDWKISRNTSSFKDNFFVRISDGECDGLGEVAFNPRYGESKELIIEQFANALKNREFFGSASFGVLEFSDFLGKLDLANSLRFGIESAYCHYYSKKNRIELQSVLGWGGVRQAQTSFSIPIMSSEELNSFFEKWKLDRFAFLKIKINDSAESMDCLRELGTVYQGKIRIDANEALKSVDEVMKLFDIVSADKVQFIEQPFSDLMTSNYRALKKICPVPVIADESLTSGSVGPDLVEQFDGINVKLMKAGGYFNGIRQIDQAKKLGLKVMLGCMVETELGIKSAMNIGDSVDYFDLDGCLLIDRPMDLLREEDGALILQKK